MSKKIKWLGYAVAILMIVIVGLNANAIITAVACVVAIASLSWVSITEDRLLQRDLIDNLNTALDSKDESKIRKAYRNLSMIGIGTDAANDMLIKRIEERKEVTNERSY